MLLYAQTNALFTPYIYLTAAVTGYLADDHFTYKTYTQLKILDMVHCYEINYPTVYKAVQAMPTLTQLQH